MVLNKTMLVIHDINDNNTLCKVTVPSSDPLSDLRT